MSDWRTPDEWSRAHKVRVLDPDGWREDGKPWTDPITEDEFLRRLAGCTVGPWRWEAQP